MSPQRARILLVDDREENLLALKAILEPLDHVLVTARSGEEALKRLLDHDIALILLDVQMPGMDGFETAAFIKQRSRTRSIPIIFLTAASTDTSKMFEGYSAGAVDYMLKPFEPLVLRSKVQVFIDLWEKGERIRRQEQQLRLAEQQARQRELDELRRLSDERYRSLAEAMPHIVWMADASGRIEYFNEQWYAYTGFTRLETEAGGWEPAVHPADRSGITERWEQALGAGAPFESEFRFLTAAGTYRWQLGRAVPIHGEGGEIAGWVGTSTDIHDRKLLEEASSFLAAAGAALASSLDIRETLPRVAQEAVKGIADWCSIDLMGSDGDLERVAIAHGEGVNLQLARTLAKLPPEEAALAEGPRSVIRSGEIVLVPDIEEYLAAAPDAPARDYLEVKLGLGLRAWVAVPLVVRDQRLGVVSLFRAGEGAVFGDRDAVLAAELAARISAALDASRLFGQAEERAQAATALATVADGVFLVDEDATVRLWNPAAAKITGLPARQVVGRRVFDLIDGWDTVEPIALERVGERDSLTHTLPVEIEGREIWLSVSAVAFEGGAVYTFRDITQQRAVDRMKSDFIATVSHELRTPLAAIAGAAATVVRKDIQIDQTTREHLLEIICEQSERLSDMIQNLLLASRLESGVVTVDASACEVGEIVARAVDSARAYAPDGVDIALRLADGVPSVECDSGHLHQVAGNLIENAIKYSPEGGQVTVVVDRSGERVQLSVQDQGIGIAPGELDRIFEKFYRLDANMTRGIGGSGLGLYICNELVRLMGGRINVESTPGEGSIFMVELPAATSGRQTPDAAGVPTTA